MLLTFDFKTVEEAQEFLAGLAAKPMRRAVVLNPEAVATVKSAVAPSFVIAPPPAGSLAPGSLIPCDEHGNLVAPKKPGRPKKAPVLEPEKELTIDDCRAALSQLFDKKGREAAKSALATFKVARIGELTAPDYAQFIQTCAEESK